MWKLESGTTELFIKLTNAILEKIKISLYNKADFVLTGDHLLSQFCKKPNDSKSNLNKMNPKKTYLNLGLQGTDYPEQLYILTSYTNNTNFDNLIWFFYEGNDYESNLTDKDLETFKRSIELNKFRPKELYLNKLNKTFDYNTVKKKDYILDFFFEISFLYKIRVYLAEKLNGLSFFFKYFITYKDLLNVQDYNKTLKIADKYLRKKKVSNKYIYYIPSWQRLANHRSKNINLYRSTQIKQLDHLKKVKQFQKITILFLLR